MKKSKCSSCGAEILWVKTEAGRSMPLDIAPVANGNVSIGGDDVATYHSKAQLIEAAKDNLLPTLYISHFATCPHAQQHRKGKS